MVDELVPEAEKLKYSRFFLRSFIEEKKTTKWCPSPGCENAVEFELGSDVYDVVCNCSCTFCWNCTEDSHRPVDCETVAKWVLKNSSEAENTEWILANSKPCPKCSRPIEKNKGCMHMACTPPCSFHFCWLCLGAWTKHGEKTGGFYACNKYEADKAKGLYNEEERRKEAAKKSSERYTHYYERWASNQLSRQKAREDLQKTEKVQLKKLSDRVKIPESQLLFILEAWEQIIECRRVLKWTYAYGYYLPEDEEAKKELFEYLQGEAETALERLHDCVETELSRDFILSEPEKEPEKDFNGLKVKLIDLTKVAHSFFENLVTALENGLSDVEKGSTSQSGQSGNVSGLNNKQKQTKASKRVVQ